MSEVATASCLIEKINMVIYAAIASNSLDLAKVIFTLHV